MGKFNEHGEEMYWVREREGFLMLDNIAQQTQYDQT
jgi:hypothetical protein